MFVDNDTFSITYTKNTSNFEHYGIKFVSLSVEDDLMLLKLMQPDFENGCCAKEHMQLIQTMDSCVKDHSLLLEEFTCGC